MATTYGGASPRLLLALVAAPFLITGTLVGSSRRIPQNVTEPPPRRVAPGDVTHVLMRNVDFYVDPQVVLHIRELHGTMRSKTGGPVLLDDKRSLVLHVSTGQIGLESTDLTVLMNKYIFGYPGAPLSKLSITLANGQMTMTGRLRKGLELPFDIRAQVDVTPDGLMRVHPVQTKILHVNGDALMRAFHLSLEKLLDLRKAVGVTVHGDDLFIDPTMVLPPPTIEGHVASVRIEGSELVQTFAEPDGKLPATMVTPDTKASNFIYFRGGSLRFGKLTMGNAEMLVVDLDPSDPFGFSLDLYSRQLIAGYARTLPSLGLEVYMRDIDKVDEKRPAMH